MYGSLFFYNGRFLQIIILLFVEQVIFYGKKLL